MNMYTHTHSQKGGAWNNEEDIALWQAYQAHGKSFEDFRKRPALAARPNSRCACLQ